MVFEVRFREDLLLFRDWLVELITTHCIESVWGVEKVRPRIDTHIALLNRREIDVVISCGGKRICIELKESDLQKAVEQAIGYIESGACDLAYIAIDLSVGGILDYARRRPDLFEKMFDHGIGLISARNGVTVFRAFHRKDASRRYTNVINLLSYLEKRGVDS